MFLQIHESIIRGKNQPENSIYSMVMSGLSVNPTKLFLAGLDHLTGEPVLSVHTVAVLLGWLVG